MKKQLKSIIEYSSIFNDSKWMCEIKIFNFSSRRATDNERLKQKILSLINKYNKDKHENTKKH